MKDAFCCVAFTLSFLPLVAADVIKVPKDFAEIQDAIDAAQPFDVVLVSPGKYDETLLIDNKADLIVRGKKGAKIRGGVDDYLIRVEESDRVTIEGFTLRPERHGVLFSGVQGGAIDDCRVLWPDLFDPDITGVAVVASFGIRVKKCVLDVWNGSAVEVASSTGIVVVKNELGGDFGVRLDADSSLVAGNEVLYVFTEIDVTGAGNYDRKQQVLRRDLGGHGKPTHRQRSSQSGRGRGAGTPACEATPSV